ncbi:hypothetical protein M8J76_004389 [Diaphorina citri]|nr:hypothetical protein M8J75_008645 [Diaphorina citri]KAI5716311.1 hypothetical protein M8J76_004389 [Diaphorina citri]KAI5717575.1 hypothetical protein M8J77_008071 [Diaphorina citri]
MLSRRSCLLRVSIVANVLVLLHFGTHIISENGARIIRTMQDSGRNLASFERLDDGSSESLDDKPVDTHMRHHPMEDLTGRLETMGNTESAQHFNVNTQAINSFILSKPNVNPNDVALFCKNYATEVTKPLHPPLSEIIPCNDAQARYYIGQRGDFWVLYNYVQAERSFHCWESITYTSHSDFTFLDNLVPLLDRWQGPVSLALYAPGTDFDDTLETIRYLRECTSPLVAEFVTFHIYFGARHAPKHIPKPADILANAMNCSVLPPWSNLTNGVTYKSQKKLLYPVNVGRNIARQTALTHYILASDIELYPSPGVITDFLDMVQRQEAPLRHKKPKVFPLSIFEVESNMNLPGDKTELVAMLKNGSAIPFHKKVCAGCHNVPKSKEWMKQEVKPGLHVFHIGKRLGYFVHWEPIYIGTHQDPYYDERLSWEGKSDKMTQGYTLCVLDYEFQILDNAFLVHKPGIKTLKKDHARAVLAAKTNALIRKVIVPELRILYGTRKGCAV